jgi:ketosteroid isomerase-like protein
MGRFAVLLSALAWISTSGTGSQAADDPAAEIRTALEQWRVEFNARRPSHICDLFAPSLRYDFQRLSEQDFTLLCDRLHRALADHTKTFQYELKIKEVIVSGSLAVVRLTWVSTTTESDGNGATDDEPGLDVFQRQPDGRWQIIRYIAYPAHPYFSPNLCPSPITE